MKLELIRKYKGPTYTVGSLYINNEYFCDTLEDTDRGLNQSMSLQEIKSIKIKNKTAIPTGTYKIDMNTVSPKFKNKSWARDGKIPRLLNVPGYEGVLIHVGNTDTDTSGCILVGQNKIKGKVVNSIITFNKLMNKLYTDIDNINIVIS